MFFGGVKWQHAFPFIVLCTAEMFIFVGREDCPQTRNTLLHLERCYSLLATEEIFNILNTWPHGEGAVTHQAHLIIKYQTIIQEAVGTGPMQIHILPSPAAYKHRLPNFPCLMSTAVPGQVHHLHTPRVLGHAQRPAAEHAPTFQKQQTWDIPCSTARPTVLRRDYSLNGSTYVQGAAWNWLQPGRQRPETQQAACQEQITWARRPGCRHVPSVEEMSTLSSSCVCPAAACSNPRGDSGARIQTENTWSLFEVLNHVHFSASRKRHKMGGIHLQQRPTALQSLTHLRPLLTMLRGSNVQ